MKNKGLILLLFILLLATFFRLWQLNSIPPGLYPDVAIYGNDGLDTLETKNFRVFYPENNGREGLFIWLLALSFATFGVSIWSIKIVAALIGILTVLGTHLLTKELFQFHKNNSRGIALLASFFLATSFWHTNFSRIGFRAVLAPLILVFALYFLIRAFRTKKLSDFVFSGIFWGLGFYTYISFRMAIIILVIILILKLIEYLKKEKIEFSWHWLWKKMYFKDGWWKVNIFLLTIILAALPIGIYFLQNSQDFIGRAVGVSIFKQANPIKAAFLSTAAHLGMFNFYGDGNWRHNFSGSPMLFWPVGILFIVGFILSIKHLIKSIKTKDHSLLTIHSLLLVWFFAMLLPGILTAEGIPHALRAIGVIPVVYIFAAIGGLVIYEWLKNIIKNPKPIFALCFLFFVVVAFADFNKYFFIWAKDKNVEGAFTKKFADIGYYLNSLPAETSKYVIVNEPGVPVPWPQGLPMPAQTVMFIENIENTRFGKTQSTYLLPEDLTQVRIKKEAVIVPMKYDDNLANEIQKRFPHGEIREIDGIWLYEIK
jgi:4-amino-4-deoxy-L-arabinose transferase-like glycosyltransferase